jgi:hypothetical protein
MLAFLIFKAAKKIFFNLIEIFIIFNLNIIFYY